MQTQSYIRAWDANDFEVVSGNVTTKGGSIKLVRVQPAFVTPGLGWQFPTTGEHYVRTKRAFDPGCWASWGFIEAISFEPETYAGAAETSLEFRVYQAGSSVYWDGAAWSAAGVGDWNNLADFNANLPSLGADAQFEIRLVTTDGALTPVITGLKLLWKGRPTSPLEEWLYRGLVKSFTDSIRPKTDWVAPADGSGSIDIAALDDLEGWQLVEVVEAYNYTSDPNRTTDILAGFAGTVATLTAPQPVNDNILLVITYRPVVAVTTDTDFNEQERIPAIIITSVTPENDVRRGVGARGPHAIDRSLPTPAGTVFRQPIPLMTFSISFALLAPLSLDLLKLSAAMAAWMQTHPTLRCATYDEEIRLVPGVVPDWATETTEKGAPRLSSGSLRMENIPWYADSQTGNAAQDSAVKVGPIDAGDADFPGEGYGVAQMTLETRVYDGTGHDTTTIT